MLFAISIGSQGGDKESYSIYIPFSLAPGHKLLLTDAKAEFEEFEYGIKVEKLETHYALQVTGFCTEDEAKRFFPKVVSGLLWVSLKRKKSISFPKEITDVKFFDEPSSVAEESMIWNIIQDKGWETLDGTFNTNETVIIPENKKLTKFENGRATITLGMSCDLFVKDMAGVWKYKSPENVIENIKLRTAVQLYTRIDFESSVYAQFLTMVIILETLTPSEDVSEFCTSILNTLVKDVRKIKLEQEPGGSEFLDMEGLENRISNNRKQSFRKSIPKYFSGLATECTELGDPETIKGTLIDVYDGRSRFLHDGVIDECKMKDWNTFLRNLIPNVLEILYLKEVEK